jgi:FAD/FMN-containing dehydrogenase
MSIHAVEESPVGRLIHLLGEDKVIVGPSVAGYATDVYRSREMPLAVVRPASVEDLRTAVRTAGETGTAVYTRGGGASYTDAYLPIVPRSILIDMSGLNRIVEINEHDGYVTVEAGITWATLKQALDPTGFRTPFFGPFSGFAASVGGSIPQHAVSHGSGAHGISAQSLVSLDIVTANGALLRTGSAARGATPFSRWYGPDITGLFCGDCGVFGIKARATLPLRKRRADADFRSFAFPDMARLAEGLRVAALEGLDDEHFAMDAAMSQGQIKRQARISKFATAKALLASSPTRARGLGQLLRSAWGGSRALSVAPYSAHFILEGGDASEARAKARRLTRLMLAAGGTVIANTVPAMVRSTPFAPLFNTLGPDGERWVPLHGYIPHSQVPEFDAAVRGFLSERESEMRRLGIWCGGMFMAMDTSAFLYELAFYWPGAHTPYHRHTLAAGYLDALPRRADDADTVAYVDSLKRDLVALYSAHRAIHFQLGKIYPFGSVISGESLDLLRALKQALDPQGIMNPGALELNARMPKHGNGA